LGSVDYSRKEAEEDLVMAAAVQVTTAVTRRLSSLSL